MNRQKRKQMWFAIVLGLVVVSMVVSLVAQGLR